MWINTHRATEDGTAERAAVCQGRSRRVDRNGWFLSGILDCTVLAFVQVNLWVVQLNVGAAGEDDEVDLGVRPRYIAVEWVEPASAAVPMRREAKLRGHRARNTITALLTQRGARAPEDRLPRIVFPRRKGNCVCRALQGMYAQVARH